MCRAKETGVYCVETWNTDASAGKSKQNGHTEWTRDWSWGRLTSRSWCVTHPLSVWGTHRLHTMVAPPERALAQERKCSRVQGPRCCFLIIWTSKLLGNYFTPIKACSYSLKNSSFQSPSHPVSKCSEAAPSRQQPTLQQRDSSEGRVLSAVQVYRQFGSLCSCATVVLHFLSIPWVPPWFTQKAFTSPPV